MFRELHASAPTKVLEQQIRRLGEQEAKLMGLLDRFGDVQFEQMMARKRGDELRCKELQASAADILAKADDVFRDSCGVEHQKATERATAITTRPPVGESEMPLEGNPTGRSLKATDLRFSLREPEDAQKITLLQEENAKLRAENALLRSRCDGEVAELRGAVRELQDEIARLSFLARGWARQQ